MFYVKNDDMEDMFKKAAEEYELNDELAADWNKVHAALQHEESTIVSTEKEKKRRKFIFFWWFLLIPAGFLIAYSTGLFDAKTTQQKQVVTTKTKDENNIVQQKQTPVINEQSNNESTTNAINNTATKQQKDYSLNQVVEKNERLSSLSINQNIVSKPVAVNNTNKQPVNNNNSEVNASSNNNNSTGVIQTTTPSASLTTVQNNNETPVVAKHDSVFNNTNEINTKSLITQSGNNQNSANKKNKSIANNYTRQAYWLTGITANADVSFVKDQHTSKLGYGGGIVAGYHLKNGLSFQTGLLFDKKNYYTSGKYFDTKNLKYFQTTGATLNYANGNCNMWEIPANVSYDFKTRKNYNWFVTAGLSSYLMHNEYYDFNYKVNGNVYDKGYNYPHSSKDYFSVMNIGAGANIEAGKKIFIQIQPYFKVPLSGVGLGNLSLKSAGLNLSVVRHIH